MRDKRQDKRQDKRTGVVRQVRCASKSRPESRDSMRLAEKQVDTFRRKKRKERQDEAAARYIYPQRPIQRSTQRPLPCLRGILRLSLVGSPSVSRCEPAPDAPTLGASPIPRFSLSQTALPHSCTSSLPRIAFPYFWARASSGLGRPPRWGHRSRSERTRSPSSGFPRTREWPTTSSRTASPRRQPEAGPRASRTKSGGRPACRTSQGGPPKSGPEIT